MSFLKGVKHIGEAAVSPFVHTASGIENVVSTAHHDAVDAAAPASKEEGC